MNNLTPFKQLHGDCTVFFLTGSSINGDLYKGQIINLEDDDESETPLFKGESSFDYVSIYAIKPYHKNHELEAILKGNHNEQ